MKRVLALILSLLACVSLLTACGEKEPEGPADRTELVYDRSGDAEGEMIMRFIDVVIYNEEGKASSGRFKAGDATLITFPNGELMLVDCMAYTAGDYLVRQLKSMDVETIDYLVISHNHSDHFGGATALFKNINVKQVYMTADEGCDVSNGDNVARLKTAAQSQGTPIDVLWEGDKLNIGGVDITCYNPPKDYDFYYADGYVETRNNSSLCLRFVYNQSSFLLAGDNYSGGEDRLVKAYGDELQSDVVKMNHHGYEASNTLPWVRAVKPLLAVATHGVDRAKELSYTSVGADTFYLHADGAVKVSTTGDGKYEAVTQYDRIIETLDTEGQLPGGVYNYG